MHSSRLNPICKVSAHTPTVSRSSCKAGHVHDFRKNLFLNVMVSGAQGIIDDEVIKKICMIFEKFSCCKPKSYRSRGFYLMKNEQQQCACEGSNGKQKYEVRCFGATNKVVFMSLCLKSLESHFYQKIVLCTE